MGLDFMARLHHRVGHGLEDGCVAAGVHSGHGHALQEGEFLHSKSFIEILPLDVLTDVVIGDGGAVMVGGAEVHAGGVVVLVIDDVHLVVTVVFELVLFLFEVPALQDHNLFLTFLNDLVFRLDHFRFLQVGVESSAANVLLEEQVLLPFIEVLADEILVLRSLPLPIFADLDEVVACAFELIRGEFAGLLEHVFFGRRAPFLADFLHHVVGDILAPIPPAHYDINIMTYLY